MDFSPRTIWEQCRKAGNGRSAPNATPCQDRGDEGEGRRRALRLYFDDDPHLRRGGARRARDFGAHTRDEVGEMVAAGCAVLRQQFGGRGVEELRQLLQACEPGSRAALFPIADRGCGDAEPLGEVGLAQSLGPAEARELVAKGFKTGGAVEWSVDHGSATFQT